MARIERVRDIIREYADCQNELDLHKVAAEVYDICNDRICPHCGAELNNYHEMMHTTHDHYNGKRLIYRR